MKEKILIVDDQVSFCNHIQTVLQMEGYQADVAHNAGQALAALSSQSFDILLTDMKLPGMDGLKLLEKALKQDPDLSCIIMTAYGSISSAVTSIKHGAADYLQKPFEPESLLMVIQKTVRERRMVKEIRDLRREVNKKYSFGNIIGKNHKMQAIYELIKKVSSTDARVFITGETGVGKELVAKAIHFNSLRKKRPFVSINCGALAETLLETELFGHERGAFTGAIRRKAGKFEYARGGTVFLDEVGDISTGMQVKLLRVLQERQLERVGGNQPIDVDVRIISATNQDIKEKISAGQFRIDLFYRLNVVQIHIPPLRERIEDIPLLVNHFIRMFNRTINQRIENITTEVLGQLMKHTWPGNVRELENVLERAFVTTEGDTIETIILPHDIQHDETSNTLPAADIEIPFKVARSMVEKRFEKTYILAALKRYEGNVSKAAKKTGINPRTLWRKMKEHELERSKFVSLKNKE
jgi:DNA-binding NtrC family response regulator